MPTFKHFQIEQDVISLTTGVFSYFCATANSVVGVWCIIGGQQMFVETHLNVRFLPVSSGHQSPADQGEGGCAAWIWWLCSFIRLCPSHRLWQMRRSDWSLSTKILLLENFSSAMIVTIRRTSHYWLCCRLGRLGNMLCKLNHHRHRGVYAHLKWHYLSYWNFNNSSVPKSRAAGGIMM